MCFQIMHIVLKFQIDISIAMKDPVVRSEFLSEVFRFN